MYTRRLIDALEKGHTEKLLMTLQEEDRWTLVEMILFAAGGMVIVFALLSLAAAILGGP